MDAKTLYSRCTKKGDCWEYPSSNPRGYAQVRFRGRRPGAHKVSYILSVGEVPEGLFVCHKCDNPPCCNPDHLFLGTNQENILDARDKGRLKGFPKGLLHHNAKMSAATVRKLRMVVASGYVNQRCAAAMFGVGESHVSTIIHHKRRI